MKLLILFMFVFVRSAFAEVPYEWNKDIGNNRFERGIDETKKLSEIKGHDIFRLSKSCEDDEVLITGGCGAAYGIDITSNFPFTSRVKGSKTEWVCIGKPNFKTALTVDGNYPLPNTPLEELVGDLMVVVVCEKKSHSK